MTKRAVCIGINDYPGTNNDLNGCVNDCNDWANLLQNDFSFGSVIKLTDSQATKDRIVSALDDLVSKSKAGDVAVLTYSGHGTWVYDQGERDESDNRDEAICAFDGNVIDDTLRGVIQQIDPDARLTIVSDSCHSGTVTRAMLARSRARGGAEKYAPKPRYMPPEADVDAARSAVIPIRQRFLYPETGMAEVLLTGCNATEYSYDAYINGRYNGAMTATAIRLIKQDPGQTYRQFHAKMRHELPSNRYPQSPQLEGVDNRKDVPIFSSAQEQPSPGNDSSTFGDPALVDAINDLLEHLSHFGDLWRARQMRP